MARPPVGMQDIEVRWARPREVCGESSAVGSRLGVRPAANSPELLDPARRVFLGADFGNEGGIVNVLVEIGLALVQGTQSNVFHDFGQVVKVPSGAKF